MEILKVKIQTYNGEFSGYKVNDNSFYPKENCELIKQWIAEGNTPEPEFTDAELLANAQTTQISIVEKSYQEALTVDIAYMNTTFQADSKSVDLITQVLAVGSVPTGFYWRDKTNNDVAMTYAEIQGLASAIQSRGLGYFTKYQNLKTQINNATTVEDIKAVVWS